MFRVEGRASRVGSGRLTDKGYFGFENLEVYQLAKALFLKMLPLLAELPREEIFARSNQLRRASSSVVLNIAEGKGRGSDRDFVRYLYQARGSLLETVAALDLAETCGYLKRAQTQNYLDAAHTLNAKLTSLIKSLSKNPSSPRP